ncbi:MAG: DUF5057 domain-containing protein, partial [Lachnospiraceae bacterium]
MNKMQELKDYVDAGLPVLIDSQVAKAYDTSSSKSRLEQLKLHDLDPDSYMYQFLEYAKQAIDDKGASNISWGDLSGNPYASDYDCYLYANPDPEKYGTTLVQTSGGEPGVTLFGTNAASRATDVYNASKVRPTLVIEDAPSEYDQNDRTTVHTEEALEVSVSASGGSGSFDFYLLIDENGDGVYDFNDGVVDNDSENKDSASGTSATLSFTLEDDFFGLVCWKVVAYDAVNNKLCDAKTGSAFFKPDADAQKECRILQIMPITKGYQYSDGHSLFFCTDCEQACGLLDYNITINGTDKRLGSPGLNSLGGSENSSGIVDGMYLGHHEHTFGISKYDTNTQIDDWEINLADELTIGPDNTLETGDFKFDLDILSVDEFDALCLEASKRSASDAEGNAATASDLYDDYEEQLKSATLLAAEDTLRTEMFKAAETFANKGVFDNYQRVETILKCVGSEEVPGIWMIKKQYYKFFEYFNSRSIAASEFNQLNPYLTDLRAAYTRYIKEYDAALALKAEYKKYARQGGTANDWISENYDVVVIGFADKFGGRDLKVESAQQLKTYVNNGGSVLNTHDSMARYNNTNLGSYNMTSALLEAFGMDRFHVTGIDDGSGSTGSPNEASVRISNQVIVLDEDKIEQNYTPYKVVAGNYNVGDVIDQYNDNSFSITSDYSCDMTLNIPMSHGNLHMNDKEIVTGRSHTNVDFDDVVIMIKVNKIPNQYDGSSPDGKGFAIVGAGRKIIAKGKTDSNGMVTFKLPQILSGDGYARSSEVELGTFAACNIEATISITNSGIVLDASSITTQPLDENQEEANIKLNVSNYAQLPPSASFSLTVGKEVRTASLDTNNAMNFAIPVSAFSSRGTYVDAIEEASSSPTKYIRYKCGRSYAFFTERLIGQDSFKYNSPIGITDMFVTYDSRSNPTCPYKYVEVSYERFDQSDLETDGSNYKAYYGTRRASKINQGGLTTYPFAIADELMISATHAQMYTLDIEDSEVNVWYTLGGNPISPELSVDGEAARASSAIFAASPHDGMNNYFLYSKGNVFYTGAGHARICGGMKDNNDERKLFINVIVNSVTKGTKKPKLKLYNVCTKTGHETANCEDEYVNPKDTVGNKALSKQMDKVFYNNTLKMYQYNVEETTEDIYPTFDFKAIAGSADLKEIQVFYDLDYGTGPGMVQSDAYQETYASYVDLGLIDHASEVNHYMIFNYKNTAAANLDDVRQRLRDSIATLKLQDDFLRNYGNYTYIVIRVKDAKNKVSTARVKVNIVPYLFDLTDATIDAQTNYTGLDFIDKREFNM